LTAAGFHPGPAPSSTTGRQWAFEPDLLSAPSLATTSTAGLTRCNRARGFPAGNPLIIEKRGHPCQSRTWRPTHWERAVSVGGPFAPGNRPGLLCPRTGPALLFVGVTDWGGPPSLPVDKFEFGLAATGKGRKCRLAAAGSGLFRSHSGGMLSALALFGPAATPPARGLGWALRFVVPSDGCLPRLDFGSPFGAARLRSFYSTRAGPAITRRSAWEDPDGYFATFRRPCSPVRPAPPGTSFLLARQTIASRRTTPGPARGGRGRPSRRGSSGRLFGRAPRLRRIVPFRCPARPGRKGPALFSVGSACLQTEGPPHPELYLSPVWIVAHLKPVSPADPPPGMLPTSRKVLRVLS